MSKKMQYDRAEKHHEKFVTIPFGLFDTHIEMFDDNILAVEGCRGILDYTDSYIRLKCKKRDLMIYGAGLSVATFEEDSITVTGRFQQIELNVAVK